MIEFPSGFGLSVWAVYILIALAIALLVIFGRK